MIEGAPSFRGVCEKVGFDVVSLLFSQADPFCSFCCKQFRYSVQRFAVAEENKFRIADYLGATVPRLIDEGRQ